MIARISSNVAVVALLNLALSVFCVVPFHARAAAEPSSGPPTAVAPENTSRSPAPAKAAPAKGEIPNQAAPARQEAKQIANYSGRAVLLVVFILLLLALLFWLLLRWSHRLDQASYLGDVYQESVEDFEYKRLASGPTEKLRQDGYQLEISRDLVWLRENPRPQPPSGVSSFDPNFGRISPGRSAPGFDAPDEPEGTRQARERYAREMDEWRNRVEAEASLRYRNDLSDARTRAKERAKLATDVDLSSLRGRGAEFVLEFTTVVVIIFAAVILGVLGILGTEQIGTLLAAIAGYVLGRATTRTTRGSPGEAATGERQPRPGAPGQANKGKEQPNAAT